MDGTILKQTEQGGYLHTNIKIGKSWKKKTVHSLVLEAFVGPRPEGYVSRHLDNDPFNNNRYNLEWSTQKVNIADKDVFGTNYHANKEKCPQGHRYTTENTYAYTDKHGHARRICKTCHKKRVAERKARLASH